MQLSEPHRFYRVVRHDPPTIEDFLSLADLGRPVPLNAPPELRAAWAAVSVFVTPEAAARQARANAARGRPLGEFVAELRIDPESDVRMDTPRRGGHVNLWAAPATLLAAVQLPVQRIEEII